MKALAYNNRGIKEGIEINARNTKAMQRGGRKAKDRRKAMKVKPRIKKEKGNLLTAWNSCWLNYTPGSVECIFTALVLL